jgi:hypothetical protein
MYRLLLPLSQDQTSVVPAAFTSDLLTRAGLVIPLNVSFPLDFSTGKNDPRLISRNILALFDTGVSKTSIDCGLADELGLDRFGSVPLNTAAGLVSADICYADLSFPIDTLRPFQRLEMFTCTLSYNPAQNTGSSNYAMLIGRDIMSHWHITWDGSTSSVFIYD